MAPGRNLLLIHSTGGNMRKIRIVGGRNGRLWPEVLETANTVFRDVMRREAADLDYEPADELKPGRTDCPDSFPVSVDLLEPGEDQTRLEAVADHVTERIRELTEDKKFNLKDIVILMPEVSTDGPILSDLLKERGIPVFFDGKGGFFEQQEVIVFRNLLMLVDNPHLDLPLLTALVNPPFDFTEEELSHIRLKYTGKKKPFWQAFSNTLILNGLYLLFRFPLTLIFALLLNEIRNLHWKKFVQTVSYLPHFISMVIVCGMIKELLSTSGPINDVIARLGGEKISFISLAEWFRTIFVASGVWQSLGWGTILYLAAMSGINPSLYEAATVDGANHFQQVLHVTIPCILPTIASLLILDIGGLVGSGGAFEKVYLLYSPMTYETSDIVSTYVFRMGVESGSINFATAVGLFEGLINLVLLTCANFVSRKVAKTSLW